MVKGLAKSETARAMVGTTKYVDTGTFESPKAGYSPMKR
jgi:hypothetical protein